MPPNNGDHVRNKYTDLEEFCELSMYLKYDPEFKIDSVELFLVFSSC